jgi:RimJ/RimL family protein N-acetyltransferase
MSGIQALESSDLRPALAVLFAGADGDVRAARGAVEGFYNYLASGTVQWRGWRLGPRECPTALVFTLLLPGNTAIVMVPHPSVLAIDAEQQYELTVQALAQLAPLDLHYVQALLEPQASGRRALLERAGFRRLAPLLYLERAVVHPWTDPPSASFEWIPYGPEAHAEFSAVLQATYEQSADCPELTGIRPVADVIAAHQASGRFDPQLWEIARVEGQFAGCLLLSHVLDASMLEIVYVGVVPAFRRRGVGSALVRRAVEQCRRQRVHRLTVVVDGRNDAARRLYERFALRLIAQRDAYWYRHSAAWATRSSCSSPRATCG